MWPEKVLRQFATIPQSSSESDYQGPYNKLLYTLFFADSDFVAVFRIPTSYDFIAMFEIWPVNRPVFILELKPLSHLTVPSKPRAADKQIRTRLSDQNELYCTWGRWAVDILEPAGERRFPKMFQATKGKCAALDG
ncbi:hypothetical protein BOTBODRAFT_141966 [Botryobasidium botryosum FD-172 SS1]|uniref:Uncharacterized protein n=1 Tax=Botryobasidium botryosum (strain FD-172 SS1) TaxID=930990 RepID=A0A067N4R2_BOTB1|nr:hypothetical protein BOTBODRAFT_141966 [Botryobasidium botryosum FD-172 SS1]